MRKETLRTGFLGAVLCVLTAGCQAPHNILVREPPTPAVPTGDLLLTEPAIAPYPKAVVGPLESTNVWVPGYWLHVEEKWLLIPGHRAPVGDIIESDLTEEAASR